MSSFFRFPFALRKHIQVVSFFSRAVWRFSSSAFHTLNTVRRDDRVVGECLFYYRIVHIIVSNVYDIFVHETQCDICVLFASDGGSALRLTGHRRYVDVATTCCEILKIVSSLTFLAKTSSSTNTFTFPLLFSKCKHTSPSSTRSPQFAGPSLPFLVSTLASPTPPSPSSTRHVSPVYASAAQS